MTRPHDDPATEPVTAQHAFEQDPEIDGDFLDEEWLEPRSTSRVTKVLVGLVLVAFGFLAGVSVGRGAADAADAAATRSTASPGGPGGGGGGGAAAAARARRARAAAGPVAPAGATGVARGRPSGGAAPNGLSTRGSATNAPGQGPATSAPAARNGGPSAAATPANAARPTPAATPAAAGGGGRSGRRRRH